MAQRKRRRALCAITRAISTCTATAATTSNANAKYDATTEQSHNGVNGKIYFSKIV